jgi:hypothetical protein
LKDEHERLKSLVAEIVDAARGNDLAKSKEAIIKAANAAGLDATGLVAENSQQWPCAVAPPAQLSIFDRDIFALDVAHIPHKSSHYDQSGRMSPRFDYGLWPNLDQDQCLKIFQPPADIVPYVGAGMHAVRGKIAWACLEYAYACLQEVFGKRLASSVPPGPVSVNSPWSLPPNSAARIFFDRVLRHSVPLDDVAFLGAMTEARIDFRRLGYMRSDNPGAQEESSQVIYQRVLEDFILKGVNKDEWLSVLEVERYIEEKMGIYEFAAFQTAISYGESNEVEMLRPLTRALTQSFVCFGDGPRWKADHAGWLVDTWIGAVDRVNSMGKINTCNGMGVITDSDSGVAESNFRRST